MSELAKKLPQDFNDSCKEPEVSSCTEIGIVDVALGVYKDPDPNIVKWINKKFTDPYENIEATVIKAFEFAGIIKPLKDTLGPLEKTGLLPRGNTPVYTGTQDGSSPFMDKREEQLLDEFLTDDKIRNSLLLNIKRLTAERQTYQKDEIDKLWSWGKNKTKGAREMPAVLRELTVMLGIRPPDDPSIHFEDLSPPLTKDLAPDIYLMMLREQESKNP